LDSIGIEYMRFQTRNLKYAISSAEHPVTGHKTDVSTAAYTHKTHKRTETNQVLQRRGLIESSVRYTTTQ